VKRVRAFVLTAALWISSCAAVIAAPVDDARRECAAQSYAFAYSVLYAKNVLGWSEADTLAAVEAGDLVRADAQAFIRAVFQEQPAVAQAAIRRMYDTCVAVRSSNGVAT